MAKGGKRIGGKPKGYKAPHTLAKEAAREATRILITQSLQALVDAQIANALGIKYLVVREKRSGKFIRVTETMARAKHDDVEDGHEIIEVWEKDPSVQAFTDLLNRALDKPKEQAQEIKLSGELEMVTVRLLAARKRLALRA